MKNSSCKITKKLSISQSKIDNNRYENTLLNTNNQDITKQPNFILLIEVIILRMKKRHF